MISLTMDLGEMNNTKVVCNSDGFPASFNTPLFTEQFRSSDFWKMRNIAEILSSGQNWVIWLINWLTTFPRENWGYSKYQTGRGLPKLSDGYLYASVRLMSQELWSLEVKGCCWKFQLSGQINMSWLIWRSSLQPGKNLGNSEHQDCRRLSYISKEW
jgi:hypothetical protein